MQRLKVYKNGEDVSMLIEKRIGELKCGLNQILDEPSCRLWYVDAIGVEEEIGVMILENPPTIYREFRKDYMIEVFDKL